MCVIILLTIVIFICYSFIKYYINRGLNLLMRSILIIIISLYLSGCAEPLIDPCCIETWIYSYKESTNNEERIEFMNRFNELNSRRKEKGIYPLDICTEKYHFDRKWAQQDVECAARIADYESGNVYAIGNSQIPVTIFE